VLDSYKVRPRLSQEFSGADKLGIYLQLYNLKLDESSRKTKVSVAYRIAKDQEEVWRTVETEDHLHQGGEQLTIERFIPVSSLAPGRLHDRSLCDRSADQRDRDPLFGFHR